MSKPVAISLFSGLGGIDIGLHQAGIETAVCVEKDPQAAKTLKANSSAHSTQPLSTGELIEKRYPWKVLEEDIYDVSTEEILNAAGLDRGEVDLLVGGPPCQTFSRSNEGDRKGTDASRGMLYEEYARVLQEVQPKAFIFENVRGLASANDGEDLKIIEEKLASAGYSIRHEVVNAADYGVPQTRDRILILGLHSDEPPHFPDPTHVEADVTLTDKPTWRTAGEALSDFDLDAFIEEQGGYENAVGGKYGYLLKDIPLGANYQHFSERKYDPEKEEYVERDKAELDEKVFGWRSRHWNYLLKQDRDRSTWTIQADPGTYVGPFHWRSRPYSLLEQMRLMDIPTSYYVAGSPRDIQRQIGNAVPPGLAENIVAHLLTQIDTDFDRIDDHPTPEADGGQTDGREYQTSFEVQNGTSPWKHAEEAILALEDGSTVTLRGHGSDISNVIDTVEIVRRQSHLEPETDLSTEVIESEDSKSDVLSVLEVTLVSA
jgi:DNA (cytosine-5)-methyltransferase 1